VLDPVHQKSVLQVLQWRDGEEVVDWSPTAAAPSFWELRRTHPSCHYRTVSGDWTSPRKVSDFLTLREFRRTPIYQASYEGRTDYWLDVGLSPVRDETHMFIFTRYKQADFDERDRLMLMLLQPHLQLRASEAEIASRAVAALATVEENASDDGSTRVVLCTHRGVIEFGSAPSRALLARYLELEDGRVPPRVLCLSELVVKRNTSRLTIRIAPTGNLRVLLLSERDCRIDLLTAREREVLDQLVRGCDTVEIAESLRIATSTVTKHLEHMYTKLGVHSRVAAVSIASNGHP
jgi:DNA-binding CsgD family transcriptional regulator